MGTKEFKASSFFDENLVDERRKTQRYKPGAFLEMNDLCGGRKVVMVGRDGVTYWDSLNTNESTPIVVHPVLQMQELGTLVSYIRENELSIVVVKVMNHLAIHMDPRATDSLFIMRVLWSITQKSGAKLMSVDDETLQWALKEAASQESNAVRVVHSNAARYNQIAAHA